MSFIIFVLPVEEFSPLFGLPGEALKRRGIIRKTADAMIEQVSFALYRDFPDAVRQSGEERF